MSFREIEAFVQRAQAAQVAADEVMRAHQDAHVTRADRKLHIYLPEKRATLCGRKGVQARQMELFSEHSTPTCLKCIAIGLKESPAAMKEALRKVPAPKVHAPGGQGFRVTLCGRHRASQVSGNRDQVTCKKCRQALVESDNGPRATV